MVAGCGVIPPSHRQQRQSSVPGPAQLTDLAAVRAGPGAQVNRQSLLCLSPFGPVLSGTGAVLALLPGVLWITGQRARGSLRGGRGLSRMVWLGSLAPSVTEVVWRIRR